MLALLLCILTSGLTSAAWFAWYSWKKPKLILLVAEETTRQCFSVYQACLQQAAIDLLSSQAPPQPTTNGPAN